MEPKVTKELEDIFKQALVAGYNQDDQAALEAVRLKNNLCACGKELGGGGVSPSRRAFKFLWAFLFFFLLLLVNSSGRLAAEKCPLSWPCAYGVSTVPLCLERAVELTSITFAVE